MESRSTIGYLKKTIEAVRRERAMEREGLADGTEGADEEEQKHIESMGKEKTKYTEVCGKLRDEKAAIEHIQKLMTSVRSKLQADFDEWYAYTLSMDSLNGLCILNTYPPLSLLTHDSLSLSLG